ncbi:YlbG family protein [Virgibacillus sp. W0181]|uniref:YlbG family protein n=1 Tax=Virgibacillus sp. W0181 TaxID=3391581 RepID=UPI003F4856F5
MRVKRQGMIVWFQHRKNIKQIRRHGHLIYVSKKMKYALIYVNQDQLEVIENNLLKLPFVSKVDRSYKPFVETNFENAIPDKAKQYDYKMGI